MVPTRSVHIGTYGVAVVARKRKGRFSIRRIGLVVLVVFVGLVVPSVASAHRPRHRPGCHSRRCDVRVDRIWAAHHRPRRRLGPHYVVSSTCYAQSGTTASGEQTRPGIVAVLPGFLSLGTWIVLDRAVFGRRRYQVLDHIGSGSELDVFNASEAACLDYGRREAGFRVVR